MQNVNESSVSTTPIGEGLMHPATLEDAIALSNGAEVSIREIKTKGKTLNLGLKRSLKGLDKEQAAVIESHLGGIKQLQQKVNRFTYVLGCLKVWNMAVKVVPSTNISTMMSAGKCYVVGVVVVHPTEDGTKIPIFVIGEREEEVKAAAKAYSEVG